jgi:hypothetical protein
VDGFAVGEVPAEGQAHRDDGDVRPFRQPRHERDGDPQLSGREHARHHDLRRDGCFALGADQRPHVAVLGGPGDERDPRGLLEDLGPDLKRCERGPRGA